MLATVEHGPRNPPGVLALEEKRLRLAVDETENLRVATDIDLALGGVDLATCICAGARTSGYTVAAGPLRARTE